MGLMRPDPKKHFALTLLGALMVGLNMQPVAAQSLDRGERRALLRSCRADIVRACPDIRAGDGRLAKCLYEKRDSLSTPCRTAIASTLGQEGSRRAQAQASAADVKIHRDVAYGNHPKQRMDIYVPQGARNATVIFMVHGGGWANGSRSSPRVVKNKLAHWLPKGFIFISVDYRLLPEANPLEQAKDVARALAAAQQKVARLGGDPARFVLMGHSAGAHLVSLLSADPSIAVGQGARRWRGVVALDSAVYDVEDMMSTKHLPLYDRAFGSDPRLWQLASPAARLKRGATPAILVCSTSRDDSCRQARAYSKKVGALGLSAQVVPLAKTHAQINAELGRPGTYTRAVDQFIDRVIR